MFLKPEEEVNTFWEELLDYRNLARSWGHDREGDHGKGEERIFLG